MKIKNKLGILLASVTFAMFVPTQASAWGFGWGLGWSPWTLVVVVTNVFNFGHHHHRWHHRRWHRHYHGCGCR